MDNRKQILTNLLQEVELSKFAQEALEQVEEGDEAKGEEIADKVFQKFLAELDLESLD